VIVFKYPGDAKINFIKRLVGLPGETLRILHGDIFTQRGEGPFEIQRKPPMKLRAMAQIVYDNDFVADAMTQKGWPVRWQPWPMSGSRESSGQWTSSDGSRTYQTDGAAPGDVWIRYQHFVPTSQDWARLERGVYANSAPPGPQLITDFYAYNGGIQRGSRALVPQGLDWVGDLLLDSTLQIQNNTGTVLLDLVKGGKHFRCALDVASGQATLSIDGLEDFHPAAQTAVKGPGTHRVLFSNVDRELRLWVDDSVVSFDAPTTYPDLKNDEPESTAADPGDLAPAGIGSRGAALRATHVRLLRDIYYIADKESSSSGSGGIWDYPSGSAVPAMNAETLADFMSNPRKWKAQAFGQESPFRQRQTVEFPLAEGQYFALGDNSPYSKDSRLWYPEHYVDRSLLIGKALFIYWPASHNRVFNTKIPFPMFPNFSSMGLVR
jgi:signal peptidase I